MNFEDLKGLKEKCMKMNDQELLSFITTSGQNVTYWRQVYDIGIVEHERRKT